MLNETKTEKTMLVELKFNYQPDGMSEDGTRKSKMFAPAVVELPLAEAKRLISLDKATRADPLPE